MFTQYSETQRFEGHFLFESTEETSSFTLINKKHLIVGCSCETETTDYIQ